MIKLQTLALVCLLAWPGSALVQQTVLNDFATGKLSNGKPNRAWTFTDESGNKLVRASYRNGQRHGVAKVYFANGELRAQGKFERGKPKGDWKFFDETGELIPSWGGDYHLLRKRWPDGQERLRGLMLDGFAHGRWDFAWPDGSPWLTAWFDRGQPIGQWRHRHLDGTPDKDFYGEPFGDDRDQVVDMPWLLIRDSLFDRDTWTARHIERAGGVGSIGQLSDTETGGAPLGEAALGLIKTLTESMPEVTLTTRPSAAGKPPMRAADLPALLVEMLAADQTRNNAALGALLRESVQPIYYGLPLVPADFDNPDDLHRALVRALSTWALTQGDEGWWHFQIRLDAGAQRMLHMRPTPFESFAANRAIRYAGYANRSTDKRDKIKVLGQDEHEAIEAGLAWLAQSQATDGHWTDPRQHDVGTTALAMLAFMSNGNTAFEGPHRVQVRQAAIWLCSRLEKSGRLQPARGSIEQIYEQLIATQALAELQAMGPAPELKRSLEKALAFTLQVRKPDSGWAYLDNKLQPTDHADSSITNWAMQAVIAAQNANLGQSGELELLVGLEAGARFLLSMTKADTGRIGYTEAGSLSARITGINDHYPCERGEALTAGGLYAKLSGAARLTDAAFSITPELAESQANLLLHNMPSWNEDGLINDMYYWFWGSQAMHLVGGKSGAAWRKTVVKVALENQVQPSGYWPATGPWAFAGGDVYSTALMVMSLAAPIREVIKETRK